jgi:predicted nucleic acid-binding protein
MDVVADTNIFLAVALNEPERERIIELTAEVSIVAPSILPYEIGNALSAMAKRGKLTDSEALRAWKSVERVPVRLAPVDVEDSLRIALEHGIHAYDAYLLQCAKGLASPLLTLDGRMKQVAGGMGIRVMEI